MDDDTFRPMNFRELLEKENEELKSKFAEVDSKTDRTSSIKELEAEIAELDTQLGK